MKKQLLILVFMALIQFCIAQSSQTFIKSDGGGFVPAAKEITAITGSDNSERDHLLSFCDSLKTTLVGGNAYRGVMFDITAISQVTITGFDINPVMTSDYRIYYKIGTYVGAENDSSQWTFIGEANNVADLKPLPTPLPIPVNIVLTPGQTYGWYITSTKIADIFYSNGTAVGNIFVSNTDIQIREGCGIDYPFGTFFSPRVFNGYVHYCPGVLGTSKLFYKTMTASVYPNPFVTAARITIPSSVALQNARLSIYNSLGAEVMNESGINSNEVVLLRKSLTAGLYGFLLKDENGLMFSGQFVIE